MIGWQMAASAILGVGALGLGSWVTHRLLGYRNKRNEQDAPGGSSAEVCMERYRPMARLLDTEDLNFLASQPAYQPEMRTRLEDSRRRIFRMYLGELSVDFHRLHAAARRMVAEAPEQHADLVPLLIRQQIAFWRALAVIEVRLALSRTGLVGVNASGLLEIVDQLQRAVSMPVAVSAPA